ncbi:RDD family protein [Bacterioplanoides sp.]|uniref:RDD family protein n=1 Tax=Bacterioplanoides sp. TaxID=2066072 RepID=UPI003B004F6E
MEEVVKTEETTELAWRGTRLGALILDCIILFTLMGPISYFLGIFDYVQNGQKPPFILTLTNFTISFTLYFAINWKYLKNNAQTIGKYVLNIRIIKLDGSKPTIKELLLKRYLVLWGFPYIPFIGGILNVINILFIFRKDHRCIHDLVAGTKVVESHAEY